MWCRVNGIKYRIVNIRCFEQDGLVLTLIRHQLDSRLEFGKPEYMWLLDGDHVNDLKLSPSTKAILLNKLGCASWYELSYPLPNRDNLPNKENTNPF